MAKDIIEEGYKKSIELLENNSTKFGILASGISKRAKERYYLSIFGRDASICSLGMVASRRPDLIKIAASSLKTLAKHQAQNGQIPNSVHEKFGSNFWHIGCIDATLWWLIALKFYNKYSGDKKLLKKLDIKAKKAIFWLRCQEHVEDNLLVQNEASDWADIMPRSGRVLYSNSLWYKIKELYNLNTLKGTHRNFNEIFYPFSIKFKKLLLKKKPITKNITLGKILKKTKPTNYYLSFVNYLFWGRDIDVYGNSLAILFGLPEKKLRINIINRLLQKERIANLPIPVLFNCIKKTDKLWQSYMEEFKQNYPYQYHNGGIWPYAACFWAMAMAKAGRKKEAGLELERIAEANKVNNWQFNEWFHAKNGKAMGMPNQSWNAAMFIFAYHYINQDITF